MMLKLETTGRWISHLTIQGAQGANLRIHGIEIYKITESIQVVDFGAILAEVHHLLLRLRDLRPKLSSPDWVEQSAALHEYGQINRDLGQWGIFMILLNDLEIEPSPNFPADPDELKWFYLDCFRVQEITLDWPGQKPDLQSVQYEFRYGPTKRRRDDEIEEPISKRLEK